MVAKQRHRNGTAEKQETTHPHLSLVAMSAEETRLVFSTDVAIVRAMK
jgi:hypothetical protein